ncbi:MAG: DNA repair REX1-B-domain-containing protein [Benjaminiella poitrasii]|nr:MAG: DNA repair REX1-B-domain-containing protein [Benjaminiella poitrasii]
MAQQPKNEILEKNEILSNELQKLLKAQNTRLELYKEFEIAFKDYMDGKCPADQYHSICKIVTEGFQDVSQEIQNVEKNISDKIIAGMIRTLQEAEKEKLEKTAKLQMLMIQAKESDKDYDETIKEYKESVKEITDKAYEVWDELREEMHGVASLIC